MAGKLLILLGLIPLVRGAVPLVPPTFHDLYTSLNNNLYSFNTTLKSKWNGSKYPVLYMGTLTDADANSGPIMGGPQYITVVQQQLQSLKAMGVQAIEVEVGFPMLYQPFFSNQAQYQQYVNFYAQVASSIRALGLKLVVENEFLLSNDVSAGWNVAPFYATLSWTEYQQARAQTAVIVAQTMKPDYMVVVEEPDTEASMTGQSEANTVSGSTALLGQILTAVRQLNILGLKLGAGVGTWHPQYLQFTQAYAAMPVDFIDMHIFPVNHSFLPNALTIASTAAAFGKPVTVAQSWLNKVRDSELGVLTDSQIRARNPFDFWTPLDTYFIQTIENLANYTKMDFASLFFSPCFNDYMPYNSTTQAFSPGQILLQQIQQANLNLQTDLYTSTGMSYYGSILSAPDKTPPSIPANVTGGSGAPTSAYLTWNASSDNVGVAGYLVYRNGQLIGTTINLYYVDSGLAGSTLYSYAVSAVDLAGNASPVSLPVSVRTVDTIPPKPPTTVTAKALTSQEVSLAWSGATDNVGLSAYRLFRGTSPASLSQFMTLYATSTSFIDYPVNPATMYYYGVEAVDTFGNISPMSVVTQVTTPAH